MKVTALLLAVSLLLLVGPALSQETSTKRVFRSRTGGSMMSNVNIAAAKETAADETAAAKEETPAAVSQDARAMLMTSEPTETPNHTVRVYRSRTGGSGISHYRVVTRDE